MQLSPLHVTLMKVLGQEDCGTFVKVNRVVVKGGVVDLEILYVRKGRPVKGTSLIIKGAFSGLSKEQLDKLKEQPVLKLSSNGSVIKTFEDNVKSKDLLS